MQIKTFLSTLLLILSASSIKVATPCDFCHLLVGTVQKSTPSWPLLPILEQAALTYCVRAHLQDKTVCRGAIKEMA